MSVSRQLDAVSALNHIAKNRPEALIFFLVDGDLYKKENGWQAYERREPGCVQDFFKALLFAIQDLDNRELTPEYICCLHALCAKSTSENLITAPGEYYYPLTNIDFLNLQGHMVHVQKDLVTAAGIQQFLENEQKYGGTVCCALSMNSGFFSAVNLEEMQSKLSDREESLTLPALAQKLYADARDHGVDIYLPQGNFPHLPYIIVKLLLEDFQKALANAKTQEEKKSTIITYTQLLEQHHGYSDVNGRTHVNLLMLRCLLQQNMLPPMLKNYNIFELGYVEDVLKLLDEGMLRTHQLVTENKLPYGLPDQDAEESALLAKNTRVFRNGITPALAEEFKCLKHRMGYLRLAHEFTLDFNATLNKASVDEESLDEGRMENLQNYCFGIYHMINRYPFTDDVKTQSIKLPEKPNFSNQALDDSLVALLKVWQQKLLDYHHSFYTCRSPGIIAARQAQFKTDAQVASSSSTEIKSAEDYDHDITLCTPCT